MAKSKAKQQEEYWAKIRAKIAATDKAVLRKSISGMDGWSIYGPERFRDAGLDEEIIQAVMQTIESDKSDPKTTIFKDNKVVDRLTGVYGLRFVQLVASVFDVHSCKLGRGSMYWDLVEQLQEKFK